MIGAVNRKALAAGWVRPFAALLLVVGLAVAAPTNVHALAADVSLTKTDGLAVVVPGSPVTYTIVVSGSVNTVLVDVVDNFPIELTGVSWSCVAAGGSTCSPGGLGDINDLAVTAAVGGTATYTVNAIVDPCATVAVNNTATATVLAPDTENTPLDNTDTDATILTPEVDLAVTKTDSQLTDVPGTTITYTMTVTNNGTSCEPAALVTDTFSTDLTGVSWTCSAAGGASCGAAAGVGNIAEVVDLGAAGTVTYTVLAAIDPCSTGLLTNSVTATESVGVSETNGLDNSITDGTTLTPEVDIAVTKTDGLVSTVPGSPITYTITVANTGPSCEPSALIVDVFPADITGESWTCAAVGGASCGAAAGVGSIAEVVDLSFAGTVTYTVNGTVDACASGSLDNTATAFESVGVTDTDALNNVAIDTTTLVVEADLSIIKVADEEEVLVCNTVEYTLTVTNIGPSCATAIDIVDILPPEMSFVSSTGACVDVANTITCSLGDLDPGEVSVVVLEALVSDFGAKGRLVENTAVVSSATTDPQPLNDTASEETKIKSRDPYNMTITGSPRFLREGAIETREYLLKVRSLCDPIVTTTNVAVDAKIPVGESYVASVPPPAVQAGQDLSYLFPSMVGLSTEQALITTQLVPGTEATSSMVFSAGSIDDEGHVAADTWIGGLRASTVDVGDAAADSLSIDIASGHSVLAGQDARLTLSIGNASQLAATDVLATLVAPSTLALTAASPSADTIVPGVDTTLYTWDISAVSGPGNQQIDVELGVPGATVDGTLLGFSATVSDAQDRSDVSASSMTVRSFQSGTTGTDVDLSVDLVSPRAALVGSQLLSTVTVTNGGRDDAAGVTLSLDGPESLALLTSIPEPASVVSVPGRTIVTWDLATVGGPGHEQVKIRQLIDLGEPIGSYLDLVATVTDVLANSDSDSTSIEIRD